MLNVTQDIYESFGSMPETDRLSRQERILKKYSWKIKGGIFFFS